MQDFKVAFGAERIEVWAEDHALNTHDGKPTRRCPDLVNDLLGRAGGGRLSRNSVAKTLGVRFEFPLQHIEEAGRGEVGHEQSDEAGLALAALCDEGTFALALLNQSLTVEKIESLPHRVPRRAEPSAQFRLAGQAFPLCEYAVRDIRLQRCIDFHVLHGREVYHTGPCLDKYCGGPKLCAILSDKGEIEL